MTLNTKRRIVALLASLFIISLLVIAYFESVGGH